jgi:hypothetical protein
MSVPTPCPRCGTVHVGQLILPTSAVTEALRRGNEPLGPGDLICPKCNHVASEAERKLLFDLFLSIKFSEGSTSDLQRLLTLARNLQLDNVDELVARRKLEDGTTPSYRGLARFVPRGQANVLAFVAVLISSATLVENILGDWEALTGGAAAQGAKPSQSADPDPRRKSAERSELTLISPSTGQRFAARSDVFLRGKVALAQGFVLCVLQKAALRSRSIYKCAAITTTSGPWSWSFYDQMWSQVRRSGNHGIVLGCLRVNEANWLVDQEEDVTIANETTPVLPSAATLSHIFVHADTIEISFSGPRGHIVVASIRRVATPCPVVDVWR